MKEQNSTEVEAERGEPNGGTRVVDRRRYVKLLTEELGGGASTQEPQRFPTYVEELQAKVKASEDRVLEYAERYRQSRDQMEKEVEAIRERLQRALEERLDQARGRFIGNLVQVLDNLRRGLQTAESDPASIVAGLRATLSLFEKSLESEGVNAIEPEGEVFDPRFHEAVDTISVGPDLDGLVVEVVEPGYCLGVPDGSRPPVLVRPAKVRVGKADQSRQQRDKVE